jgi:hypothetical protein
VLGFSSKARGLGGRPALTDAAVGCSGENDFEVTAAALEPFRAFLASGAGKVKQGKPAKTPLKDGTNNNAFHVYGRDDLDLVDVPEPAAIIAAATPGARLVCRPGSRSALLHPNSVAPLAAGRWLTVGALGRYISRRGITLVSAAHLVILQWSSPSDVSPSEGRPIENRCIREAPVCMLRAEVVPSSAARVAAVARKALGGVATPRTPGYSPNTPTASSAYLAVLNTPTTAASTPGSSAWKSPAATYAFSQRPTKCQVVQVRETRASSTRQRDPLPPLPKKQHPFRSHKRHGLR